MTTYRGTLHFPHESTDPNQVMRDLSAAGCRNVSEAVSASGSVIDVTTDDQDAALRALGPRALLAEIRWEIQLDV